jgi:hypothetical protein
MRRCERDHVGWKLIGAKLLQTNGVRLYHEVRHARARPGHDEKASFPMVTKSLKMLAAFSVKF